MYKDYTRPVSHINSIPMESLENVKEWLDSSNIPFTEGPLNLNWPTIMKTVIADPHQFFKDGNMISGVLISTQIQTNDVRMQVDGTSCPSSPMPTMMMKKMRCLNSKLIAPTLNPRAAGKIVSSTTMTLAQMKALKRRTMNLAVRIRNDLITPY